MRRLRPGDYAWITLAAGVISYDLLADDLMSEAADRYLAAHPWWTRAIVALTAAHLINLLPDSLDPFCRAAILRKAALSHTGWGRPSR